MSRFNSTKSGEDVTSDAQNLPTQPSLKDTSQGENTTQKKTSALQAESIAAKIEANEQESGEAHRKKKRTVKTQAERKKASQRRKRTLKRAIPTLLCTLVYTVLMVFMFANAGNAAVQGVRMSLRYDSAPLSSEAVHSAKYRMGNPDEQAEFSASYWNEVPDISVSTLRTELRVKALIVDGEVSAVVRPSYIFGGEPPVLQKQSAAVSEQVAWELFGGTDIVGATFTWDEQEYTVSGVFEGSELLVIVQVDARTSPVQSFRGVQLSGEPEGDARTAAQEYASTAGLGDAQSIINDASGATLLAMMAWLPAVVVGVWFAVKMLRLLRRASYLARNLTWFALIISLAFVIPWALSLLPPWVIPARWSDMEHWRIFLEEISARITEWMSVNPNIADVHLRQVMIGQALLMVLGLFAIVGAMRRWSAYIRRGEAKAAFLRGHVQKDAAKQQDLPESTPSQEQGEQSEQSTNERRVYRRGDGEA